MVGVVSVVEQSVFTYSSSVSFNFSSVSVPHLILQQSRDLPTTSSLGLVGNYHGAVELASPTRLVRLARLVLEVEDRGGVDDFGRHWPWRELFVFASF